MVLAHAGITRTADRETLILSLWPLAEAIAGQGRPHDERLADGAIGLIRAVDTYDPARGASLRTWAAYKIRLAIADGHRDRDHLTRLQREQGYDPDRPASLSAAHLSRRGQPLSADHWEPAYVEPGYDQAEARAVLARLLPLLTARERYVLGAYYWQNQPQAAIGADLGISEGRVSQIRSSAIARLRAAA